MLIEIILSVLFLSLASIVCVRFFSHANTLGKKTGEMTQAVIVAQNLAEAFLIAEDEDALLSHVRRLYPQATEDAAGKEITVAFDKTWENPAPESAALYEAVLSTEKEEAHLYTARISVYDAGRKPAAEDNAVYTLQVSSFREEDTP